MVERGAAFKTSPSNPGLGEIQTRPERVHDMPYAPAIRVEAPGDLLFISGATPSPLYHKHPHQLHEHNHPVGIAEQTRLAMENIKTILDHQGLTWTDVVNVSLTATGPAPGPPPPCGVENVLCVLKCMTSKPAWPGLNLPRMAFMFAPSM